MFLYLLKQVKLRLTSYYYDFFTYSNEIGNTIKHVGSFCVFIAEVCNKILNNNNMNIFYSKYAIKWNLSKTSMQNKNTTIYIIR